MAKADMSWLEHAVHLPLPPRDPALTVRFFPSKQRISPDWEIFDPRTGYACRPTSGSREPWAQYTFIKNGVWYKIYYVHRYHKEETSSNKAVYRITSISEFNHGNIESLSDDKIYGSGVTIENLLSCLSVAPYKENVNMNDQLDVYYAPVKPGEHL